MFGALWALTPTWVKLVLAGWLVGLVMGGSVVHSLHKAFDNGSKNMAARVLERLDKKVDQATDAVAKQHADNETTNKVKERVIYREVMKRVPQKDPAGCPPIDDDTLRLLNAARSAKSAEEFMRITAPFASGKAQPAAKSP